MRNIFRIAVSILALGIFSPQQAVANQGSDVHMSAHSCKVRGDRLNSVAYHSAGSLIALEDNVRVTCPITTVRSIDSSFRVILYFRTHGARGGNLIKCWINTINHQDRAESGSPRAAGIQIAESLELAPGKTRGVGIIVGGNVNCDLQKNAKILGYVGIFRD